jgi:hypothetical protein
MFLAKSANFNDAARRLSLLAQNEKWLVVNFDKTIHASEGRIDSAALAEQEANILRCLRGPATNRGFTPSRPLRRSAKHCDRAVESGSIALNTILAGSNAGALGNCLATWW